MPALEGTSKAYGDHMIVQNFSIRIMRGDRVGIEQHSEAIRKIVFGHAAERCAFHNAAGKRLREREVR